MLTRVLAVLEHPCTYTQLEATTDDMTTHSLTHSLTYNTGSKHKLSCLCSKLPGTPMALIPGLATASCHSWPASHRVWAICMHQLQHNKHAHFIYIVQLQIDMVLFGCLLMEIMNT